MPMIDVYATTGRFADKPALLKGLNETLMRWEQVPLIDMFIDNTAAFLHELPADAIADAAGKSDHIRIQVLTPEGTLDRTKKLGVTKDMTELAAAAAKGAVPPDRIWVQIVEAPDGGWGMGGHA